MAIHWFPFFKLEKCAHCGKCISACPHQLLFQKQEENKPDGTFVPKISNPELCPMNCSECVKSCDCGVIGIIRPAKPCDCCSF
ncbi:4Fe-4S dicluster domain-containing protein [Methanolapillus africanus]|uniref:4Fe-4S dicluster domain-containing protein n=1 Tax=Methanolapillus africanus TaxID=3028297 RepID=UPI0030B90EF9